MVKWLVQGLESQPGAFAAWVRSVWFGVKSSPLAGELSGCNCKTLVLRSLGKYKKVCFSETMHKMQ